jgi:hypothetical protein
MKATADRSSFIETIQGGEASFLRVRLVNLPETIEAIAGLGLQRNPAPNNWNGLRGLCPQCSAWVDGATLGMLPVIGQIGREKVKTSQYGELSHLLDQHCINSACSSAEILLIWQGEAGIRKQLRHHLQRVRAHLTSHGDGQNLDCLDKLGEEQALSFTQDAIFGLEQRCRTTHLIAGRRFPNMIVWVSALPAAAGAAARAFPSGYKAYLGFLLKNSGFDQGDLALAHWISFPYQGEPVLNLAVLSDKNSRGTARELALFPAEILQELREI